MVCSILANSGKPQSFAPARRQHLSVARTDARPSCLRIFLNKTRRHHKDSDTIVAAIASSLLVRWPEASTRSRRMAS